VGRYGAVTRESALQELKEPPCDPALVQADKEFVIKKLGLSDLEFEQMMRAPVKTFRDYGNSAGVIRILKRIQHALRSLGLQYR
jgi:hypothetical protein